MRVMLLTLAIAASLAASAQRTADEERDHVRVTLSDGTVVEGYIKTYWTSGKMFKRMNTSFSMSPTPSGENATSYDADGVRSVDFVVKTSADGKYDHLESMLVANPSVFKPGKTRRQFVYKEGETEAGAMYWWNGVDSQEMQLGKVGISTIYGLRLAGDDVVVPFMTGNVISLNAMRIRYKKTNPGLVDYVDSRVLRGGKRLWDAIAARPMLFMEICEEYLNREGK